MATAGGYAIGAAQDYNAHRLLARTLNYDGDRLGVSRDFGGGTPVSIVGLDSDALRSQMGDARFAPVDAPPAAGPGTPGTAVPSGAAPGSTAPASQAGAPPAATGRPGGSTPPPQPGPHPPTPSPRPTCNPQRGTGSYDGRVTDAGSGKGVSGVTVTFYLNGCPVASGMTKNGKVDGFSAFLPNTTYTYSASGGGYATSAGSLSSASDGQVSTGIVVTR